MEQNEILLRSKGNLKSTILIAILLCFCLLRSKGGFSQGTEMVVLDLKEKLHFKERNNFLRDTIWRFNNILEYNERGVADDESWIRLTLEVKDTAAFLTGKRLILPKDAANINHHFAAWSVWFAKIPQDTTTLEGFVELVNVTATGVSMRMDLIVTNKVNKDRYYYKGERTFRITGSTYDFYQK